MNPLSYFDCHASYGPRPNLHPHERWSLSHLLEDLDTVGIDQALVVHAQALLSDPMAANRRMMREIKPHRNRLMAAWVAYAPVADEAPSPKEQVRTFLGEGVRAVRMEPALFGLPPEAPLWGELADRLGEAGILITASWGGLCGSFDFARRYLTLWRQADVLLLDMNWSQWRPLMLLMDAFPRLHSDLSNFQANRAVETLASRCGARRICFGSGLPHKAAGAARAFIDWARVPTADRALMAGGNLARLLGLGGVGHGNGMGIPSLVASRSPKPSDPLVRALVSGRALPMPVYDAHCHLLPDGVRTGGQVYVMPQGDAPGVVELATFLGIKRTAVMSWEGPVCMDAESGNRTIAAALRRHPSAFWGMVSVNPETMNPQAMAALVRRQARRGWVGVKPYAVRNLIDYDDAAYGPCFAAAERAGLYVLLHVKGLKAVEAVAKRHPGLKILVAHAGQSWAFARDLVVLMRAHPMLHAELTYTTVTNGVIEYLVGEVGAARVLFGSDASMRDPRPQLGWVVFSRLPLADKRKILGENFSAVLGPKGKSTESTYRTTRKKK